MINVKTKLLQLYEPFKMYSDVLGLSEVPCGVGLDCKSIWIRNPFFFSSQVLVQHCQGHVGANSFVGKILKTVVSCS